MKTHTFKGGIFLKERKLFSRYKSIVPVLPKGELIYPLTQPNGLPAIPVVNTGDFVLKGQKIAETPGMASAPIYSTVSGRIKSIEPSFVPSGLMANCIIIENDGEYREVENRAIKALPELTREEILNIIDEAGIVSVGDKELSMKINLSPKEPEKIKYIIANGIENEPYITADYRRLIENSHEIVSGLKIVLRLFDNAKGILAIDNNKRDCIKVLKKETKSETRVHIKSFKLKYPQKEEDLLIKMIAKKKAKSTGCLILNLETLIAIHDAVINGRPLTERVITISGDGITSPGNYKVLLGTNLKTFIETVSDVKDDTKIILGGPMSGVESSSLDVPITKTTPSIVCLKKDKQMERDSSDCIRCGRCVDVCPRRLVPTKLASYAEKEKKKRFTKRKGLECTGCGSCSYVCPAKRKLKQSINPNENTSPYICSKVTTTRIMLWMIISLMPTTLFGIIKYGTDALNVLFFSIGTAVFAEMLFKIITRKKITIGDLSAAVTGLLLGLNLPSNTSWWMCVIASLFAIIVLKQMFGGLGRNIINPALGAKCLLLVLFTKQIVINNVNDSQNLFDAFIGNTDATIGGTSIIAIFIGAIILLMKGIINIRIPGMYLLAFVVSVTIFGGRGIDLHYIASYLCDGGLMFIIWFMSTDYGTSPLTKVGKSLYGLLLGVLSGISIALGYIEAIPFVIVIGNLFVPLIEYISLPRTSVKTKEDK